MNDDDDEALERVRNTEIVISNVLRFGTIASFCIVMLGMIVSFIHHPDYLRSPEELARLTKSGALFPHTLQSIWTGLLNFRGQAIVEAGLILLILTPVMRVLVSIFAFIVQKDRNFIAISSLVFLLLILSFLLGGEG